MSTGDTEFGSQIHDALLKEDPAGLEPEQLKIYEMCLQSRDQIIEKVFGGDAPNIKVIKERRLWCQIAKTPGDKRPNPERLRHSAQADYIARLGSRLLIVEYKSLPGDVPASPQNEQMRDQSVMASRQLVASEIICAIVQPLVTMDPELCIYDSITIARAEQEMFKRVRNSNNPHAQRSPNPTSCKFCKAVTNCAEYQQWAGSQLPDTAPITGVPVSQWTPQQRAHFCKMLPVAQKWLDDAKEAMKRQLKEDASSIPGYHLKDGAEQQTINDPQELFTRVVALGQEWAKAENGEMHADHVLLPLFMDCVKVGKGDLEAMIRKITGHKGKQLLGTMNTLLDGIVDVKQNDSSLAKVKGS